MPSVTVLMAVHNGAEFLAETLASVAAQTMGDYEFVIVDDASMDETGAILARAAAADSRIRVLRNAENLGLTRSLNVGLRAAGGEFIARIDADDLCLPERLAVQLAFLRAHPDYTGVACGHEMIDEHGNVLRRTRGGMDDWQVRWLAAFNPPAPHPAYFFRRVMPDGSAILYDEQYRTAQDFDLWSRLGLHGRTCVLPDLLIRYRRHPGAITVTKRREQALNCAAIGRGNIARRLPADIAAQLDALVDVFAYQRRADPATIRQVLAACEAMLAHDLATPEGQAHRGWLRRTVAGLLADALLSRGGALGDPAALATFLWAGRAHLPHLAMAVLEDPGLALKSLRNRSRK